MNHSIGLDCVKCGTSTISRNPLCSWVLGYWLLVTGDSCVEQTGTCSKRMKQTHN